MISFLNDYSEGALPEVLDALTQTNYESTVGYGCDEYCKKAADRVRALFACPEADVHFLPGGTVTNTIAISALLRPWEAVIAADTAHIAVHETGAIESSGHKVYTIKTKDGKLCPEQIEDAVIAHRGGDPDCFGDEHMVLPRMVYVSDATELGTVYTKAELTALREVCDRYGLYLYLDGARMAPALVCRENDLRPEDFAQLCDAFYLGGTKNGLLFGEALVVVSEAGKPGFRHMIKQRGGMMAKGRLLGVQFNTLLQNDLWLRAAKHAVASAGRVRELLLKNGYTLYADSPSNMVFPVLENKKMEALRKEVLFDYIAKVDETHSAVRFVCSWATREESIDELEKLL